ncbi:LysR family transcriptional regulator [Acetobacteraceae bacterium ESL0709]|nr:LysR family transcriptional regulator [Acetobacteraceae bacterium ESL0697]MDF7678925.1 LysR family transcriptional regulator [Acetobacteraceae bacterium ESL0709]
MPRLPDFEAWAIFSIVAREGSFAAAAHRLNLSRPTISRAVSRLEQELGVTLLQRTSRHLSLTQAGQEALEHAHRLYDEGKAAEASLKDREGPLRGPIKMSFPISFGFRYLAPILGEFMTEYPDITLELDCDDTRVNLISGQYDLAVRISAMVDSSLKVRQVCEMPRFLVASPQWIEQYGKELTPRDLEDYMSVVYTTSRSSTFSAVRLNGPEGQTIVVNLQNVRLLSNNAEMFIPILEAGHGIGLLPLFLIERELAEKKLEIVLPEWSPERIFLHVLTPPIGRRPARVDAFINWLVAHLKKESWTHSS